MKPIRCLRVATVLLVGAAVFSSGAVAAERGLDGVDAFTLAGRQRHIPAGYTASFAAKYKVEARSDPPRLQLGPPVPAAVGKGAVATGKYRNLFSELGYSAAQVQARLEAVVSSLFWGDPETEAVLVELPDGSAYIHDVGDHDVRTEGMSYAMTVAVQMDNATLFRSLWQWTTTHMRHNDPADPRFGYFAWHCSTDGNQMDPNPASDGETYFATALYMAAARWNDTHYAEQADTILACATNKTGVQSITPMFNPNTGVDTAEAQVVFVPFANSATFTDPSYHLPAFYELWARSAPSDGASFWSEMGNSSRAYLKLVARSSTAGLAPDYSHFDGTKTGSGVNGEFAFDAWRVSMNAAMDYAWFAADPWQIEYCNGLLAFFKEQNATAPYANQYALPSLKPMSKDHSPGLVGTNAVCALASDQQLAWDFVQELWDTRVPTGQWRYYDGMLYLLSWLHVSGNFKYYGGKHSPPSPPSPPSPQPPLPPPPPNPPPSPNPPSPPSPSPGSLVEFKRNGQCLKAGGAGSAAALGGCYVPHGSTDTNEWRSPDTASPLVSATNQLQVGAAGCAVGETLMMGNSSSARGMLGWGMFPGQLVLLLCPNHLCAGDASGLSIMSCDDQRAHGWIMTRP